MYLDADSLVTTWSRQVGETPMRRGGADRGGRSADCGTYGVGSRRRPSKLPPTSDGDTSGTASLRDCDVMAIEGLFTSH